MHRHFIMNKPAGVVSQFINNRRRKKITLGHLFVFPEGTMAIGRLDAKTEGLLLLTTDGKESERIRSKDIEKEYWAQVDGVITSVALKQLCEGVLINNNGSGYVTLPAKAKLVESLQKLPSSDFKIRDKRHGPTSWISITVNEGKYKQIRKMTAAVGFPTLRLVRVRVGNLMLFNLPNGKVIEVGELNV